MHLDSPTPEISQIRAAHTLSEKASLVGLGAPAWQASIWYSLWVEVDTCQCLHSLSCSSWWAPFLSAPGLFFLTGKSFYMRLVAQLLLLLLPRRYLLITWICRLYWGDYLIYWIKNWHKESSKMKKEEYVPTKRTRKRDFNKIEKKNKEKRLQ